MSLDKYTNIRVIGKGSYGEVWLVRHKSDRKQYVLKKLEVKHASKRERYSAEQEAKLLSKLHHPNIVTYKDSFENNGHLYIAMGFCEGGDLFSKLKEQRSVPLEERQIVEWFVQISMALQYMHERNILHRDLKTQNIFLTKASIIKVGDLGIAKVLDNPNDMASTLIGTPYYMSPELFSNKPYNHKSDVWALGCCVYEMATLKHAFNAKDMNSLVYKILRGKLPSMPKIYSDELVTMIRAMLNQNPDKRPSVNRILKDPFIKKNIAIFLDGTRKNKATSAKSKRPPSGERSRKSSQTDDDAKSVLSVASSVGVSYETNNILEAINDDEKLEPLHPCGPELTPIAEEMTPRKQYPPPKSADQSPKTSFEAKQSRPASGQNSRSSTPTRASGNKELPPRSPDVSGTGARKKKKSVLKMRQSSNENSEPNKEPLQDPIESRPLPPRPLMSGNPKSKNSSAVVHNRESGYSSEIISSCDPVVNKPKGMSKSHDPSSPTETKLPPSRVVSKSQDIRPQMKSAAPRQSNLSARARRREKKEMEIKEIETPRMKSSVDIDPSRRSIDIDSRPSSAKSRPSSAKAALEQRSQKADISAVKRTRSESDKSKKPLVHQRSFNNSSSSDEDEIKRDERRNHRDVNNLVCALESTLKAASAVRHSGDDDDDNGDVIIPGGAKVPNVRRNETFVIRKHVDPPPQRLQVEPLRAIKVSTDPTEDAIHPAERTLGTATRLNDRIQQLRKDVIRAFGIAKLKAAYDVLEKVESEDAEPKLIKILGQDGFDEYAGKIWQLKFCEDVQSGLV
ncbi:DgyrCDS4252 [Dimorphilus gyrociliatus]|uniref:Serine/threonine-protein kinase Nek4 n=1 Tax=Dimorphilus gyrociliatus TaxID=2664684 RepID=A0A7I8VIL2_9ANNE|nr:DgyrCDS4252 [Dimorphilus gyrociliatus]